MLEFRSREQTLVRRLRIAGAGLEPVATRLRVERAFASLDLPALGLPPSAVLCIRKFADPRPRTCRLGIGELRLPPAWRDSVRTEFERMARGAMRPARETVAASADCVLFADASELLSAAAEDWLTGRIHARWWWKSLLGAAASGGGVLPGLWLREPEYVPGALEHLAAKGKAAEFARRLPAAEARDILRRVAVSFGLSGLDQALTYVAGATAASGSSFVEERSDARPGGGFSVRPPWDELVRECRGAGLDTAGESLLGVGLSLSRAPALARREDFARRAAAWAGHATGVDSRPDMNTDRSHSPRDESPASPASPASNSQGNEHAPRELTVPPPSAPGSRDELTRRLWPRATGHAVNDERRPAGEVDDVREVKDRGRALKENESVTRLSEGVGSNAGPDSAVVGGPGAKESRDAEPDGPRETTQESHAESPLCDARFAPLLEAEIETRFGGLFHLVNLGLFLNLYGDFTTPAEPGLPLSVWDFVALLGRRLAGARVERDAVWPLLARLAGRAQAAEPGAHFSPPDEWRAGTEWLKPFGATRVHLRWADAGGRLRVAHPAGFTLIDVASEAAGAADEGSPDESPTPAVDENQLARELRPYLEAGARFDLRRVARVRGARGRTSRARWLDRLSAYAAARLSLALGARGAAHLSRLLCERHARVFVTAAHLDVVMRLGELPLEIRCSGLDRDPGWVPAAGRHIAFHFE